MNAEKTNLGVEKLKQLAAEGEKIAETSLSLDDPLKRGRVNEIRRQRGIEWMESVLLCTLLRPSKFWHPPLRLTRAEVEILILADRAERESENQN
jgi:hypothetical protein